MKLRMLDTRHRVLLLMVLLGIGSRSNQTFFVVEIIHS